MTKYVLISTEKNDKRTYGIKIIKERIVKDISLSRSVVRKLVDTCNRVGVEMEQFDDILDNFISDYETF
ncbi:MAG: hypothetical protein J1E96_03410 [Ruminococcus sp.]|nr:hypothetical protein [Ruminococcus sp.]